MTAGAVLAYSQLVKIDDHAKKYGYIDDPSYVQAMQAYQAMRRIREKQQKRKDEEIVQASIQAMHEAAKEIETYEQLTEWLAKFGPFIPNANMHDECARVRLYLEEKDQDREDRAYVESVQTFHPFIYYTIKFASMATDSDGESYLGEHSFRSLQQEPDADGFYLDVWNRRRRPANVYEVVEMIVSEHSQLPAWCPSVEETKECDSYRVPPADAKLSASEEDDDSVSF